MTFSTNLRNLFVMRCNDAIELDKVQHSQPQSRAGHDRLYEIDFLRFIAALSVLSFHYSWRGALGKSGDTFTAFSYPPLAGISRYGYLGVNMFFMISGFVILMSANGSTPRRFFISRFVRLYPAYWVCCSVTFLAATLTADPRFLNSINQYLANLTMLNGFINVPFVDGAYWSLRAEMQFYIFVFLLLTFRQTERMKLFFGLWLAASVMVDFLHVKTLEYIFMSKFAAYFVAGAAFYLVYLGGWSAYRITLLLSSYAMVLRCALKEALNHVEEYGQPCNPWIVVGCVTAFFVVFLLIVAGKLQPFRSRRLLFFGTLTYPLYLLHQNLGYIIFNRLDGHVNRHLLFWGVVGLMILAARAVHVFVERPYAKKLKGFLERALPQSRDQIGADTIP